MHFTSIAYKIDNKVYIGQIEKGLKSIELFKHLQGDTSKQFSENMIYIVMYGDTNNDIKLAQLEKIPFGNFGDNSGIADLSDDDRVSIFNKVLKTYLDTLVIH